MTDTERAGPPPTRTMGRAATIWENRMADARTTPGEWLRTGTKTSTTMLKDVVFNKYMLPGEEWETTSRSNNTGRWLYWRLVP